MINIIIVVNRSIKHVYIITFTPSFIQFTFITINTNSTINSSVNFSNFIILTFKTPSIIIFSYINIANFDWAISKNISRSFFVKSFNFTLIFSFYFISFSNVTLYTFFKEGLLLVLHILFNILIFDFSASNNFRD